MLRLKRRANGTRSDQDWPKPQTAPANDKHPQTSKGVMKGVIIPLQGKNRGFPFTYGGASHQGLFLKFRERREF